MRTFVLLSMCIAVPLAWAEPPEYVLTVNFKRAEAVLTRSDDAKPVFTAAVALPAHTAILPAHAEVITIIRNPWWYPTKKAQRSYHVPNAVPPGSPHNAMGKCKITLHFLSGHMNPLVRIHGTNEPKSIGKRVSGGCIRMHNKDILALADIIDGAHTHVRFIAGHNPPTSLVVHQPAEPPAARPNSLAAMR